VSFSREVISQAFQGGLIEDEKAWLLMLVERNESSHTYDESVADRIYNHIKTNFPIMHGNFARLKSKYNS
jgi:nucleotidyltransferase substrate binding protein (TIGR01987 family)